MNKIVNLIPNFQPLYEAICQFIKSNTGEKGFLDTRNIDKTNVDIFARIYRECDDPEFGDLFTDKIYAMKVRPDSKGNDTVFIFADDSQSCPDDKDLECESSTLWYKLRHPSQVIFYETLLNIAENVEQYALDNND